MSTVPVGTQLHWALQSLGWAANGRSPDAFFQSALTRQHNQLLLNRSKCHATFMCPIPSLGRSGGDVNRWRFAMHTSSHARYLFATFIVARADQGSEDPTATMEIRNAAGTLIGTAEYHYGANVPVIANPSDTPAEYGYGIVPVMSSGALVEIDPDTDYFGMFSDIDDARTLSASCSEVSLQPTTENGYLNPSYSLGSPVLDADRSTMTSNLRTAWKRNASPAFSWSVNLQAAPRTITSSSPTNIIDNSSTSISAATPGFHLDLSNKSTLRRSTVPVKLWLRAKAASPGAGQLQIYDAASALKGTITVDSATEQWWSTTLDLAANSQKYDILMAGDSSNLFSVYAISAIQYET